MLVCRHCGWENPDEAAFCTNCGRGLARGRAIATPNTTSDGPTPGGRFRALGSPVVTVQPSESPVAVDPPLPKLKAPSAPVSAPTLLDFRMPEQMLAELSRMRGRTPGATVKPPVERENESPKPTGASAETAPADVVANPSAVVAAPTTAPETPVVKPTSTPPEEPATSAELVSTAAMSGLGDIARALRAEASPPLARPTAPSLDPPTLDPGEVLPEDDEPEDDDTDAGLPAVSAQAVATPPPGLYADAPVQELPFFEAEPDGFSNPPASIEPEGESEETDLPFVLGPELEVEPPLSVGELAPGESVDLLPPDGSIDLDQSELAPPTPVAEAFDDPDDADEFAGLDAPVVSEAEANATLDVEADDGDDDADLVIEDADEDDVDAAPDDAIAVLDEADDPDVEPETEDVEIEADDDADLVLEDDALLNSGDMEAVVLTTKTQQPVLRAAPPPMPAAASARFVLRPLSENLDESFVVAVGDEPIDIGRLAGDLCFEDDTFLSPLHARFEMAEDALQVTDLDSLNGVWLRVREEVLLSIGATFLCGQQVINVQARTGTGQAPSSDGTSRFGAPVGGAVELAVIDAAGGVVASHRVPADGLRLGRHLADMVFTDDAYMSGTHASVRARGDQVLLRDLDSRNGTWLRLTEARQLRIGDAVMLGRTVLRVGQPSG